MRVFLKSIILVALSIAMVFMGTGFCSARINLHKPAPDFSLKDVTGETYTLSKMRDRGLVIIYFFDINYSPSVKILLDLERVAKKHKDVVDFDVWSITRSSKSEVRAFISRNRLSFPILLGNKNVSHLYYSHIPTMCILGPELKVLDYIIQPHKIMVKVAKKMLERHKPEVSSSLTKLADRDDPEAIKISGLSNLYKNNLKAAENDAKKLLKHGGSAEIDGKEILAKMYIMQRKTNDALKIIKEVMQKAPNKAWPHNLKGDILLSQGKNKKALAEYEAATKATAADTNNIAIAHSKIAQIKLREGKTGQAVASATQAVEVSPHDVINTTTLAKSLREDGKDDEANKACLRAHANDRNDVFAAILAKRAQDMIDLQKDAERRNQINQQIKDLVERYKSMRDGEADKPEPEDTWTTSKLMVLTFLDFKEEGGGLPVREGFITVLTYSLTKQLNDSGRVQVVNRTLVERTLRELNLSSSVLADPKTRRKLGRLFGAKIIATGGLKRDLGSTDLRLKLIDVETTKEPLNKIIPIASGVSLKQVFHQLNREILTSVIKNYPLQGQVAFVEGANVTIDIGPDFGVVMGTVFNVIEEREPINFDGKILKRSPIEVARIKVTKLEKDHCIGQIIYAKPDYRVKKYDKLTETIPEFLTGEKTNVW